MAVLAGLSCPVTLFARHKLAWWHLTCSTTRWRPAELQGAAAPMLVEDVTAVFGDHRGQDIDPCCSCPARQQC